MKIVIAKNNSLKLKGKYFIASVKEKNNKTIVEKLFKEWYKIKAEYWFNNLFNTLKPIANKFYKGEPTLKYKWMEKRWGS